MKVETKEHRFKAFQCTDCRLEFVIVCLNQNLEWKKEDPFCPQCGDADEVAPIDCLDFLLVERVQQYELVREPKPLPEKKQ